MSDTLRFRLNGEPIELGDVAPTTTLLNWLRYDRRLTGTKEGCAEGDCGACTVALREPGPDGVTIRPICSCIQLIGMVHGCDVITVEGLTGHDGSLHPVQAAMVDEHGSQCGFCTPGVVMSLWCGWCNREDPNTKNLNDLLAGNLCRCTGYGPILRAGHAAFTTLRDWENSEDTICQAMEKVDAQCFDYTAAGRRFVAPTTVEDFAQAVLDHPGATIVSGATDVGLWMTKAGFDPDVVLYTGRIPALRCIERIGDTLWIGAGARYDEAVAPLTNMSNSLGALIRRIGARQVRAMGTIGGNLANGSPIGDMPPALIALDARLALRRGGERREIALQDFFIDYGQQDLRPGEFVEQIGVPIPDDPARLVCEKITKRHDQDISAVLGCFDIQIEDGTVTHARLAFGGMAAIPKRSIAVEAALTGKPWTEESIASAADLLSDDFAPIIDHRGTAAYRLQTARALLIRHYRRTANEAGVGSIWEAV